MAFLPCSVPFDGRMKRFSGWASIHQLGTLPIFPGETILSIIRDIRNLTAMPS